MKIVFLISSFQAGGAERVGSWLVARLAGAGYDVVAATLSGKDFFYALDPRVRTVKLGLVRPSRGPIDALLASRRRVAAVERLVRDVAPDLLLSFMTAPNLIAIRAGRRAGVPVIVAERNCRGAAIVSVFQDLFRRFLYPRASAVVLQTEADAANYAFLHEASVIPNPVAAPSAAARPRKRIILAVGRLERQKGFDLLLEAFALVEDRRDWRLLIAGEGSGAPGPRGPDRTPGPVGLRGASWPEARHRRALRRGLDLLPVVTLRGLPECARRGYGGGLRGYLGRLPDWPQGDT